MKKVKGVRRSSVRRERARYEGIYLLRAGNQIASSERAGIAVQARLSRREQSAEPSKLITEKERIPQNGIAHVGSIEIDSSLERDHRKRSVEVAADVETRDETGVRHRASERAR